MDGLRQGVPGFTIGNDVADRQSELAEDRRVLAPQPLSIPFRTRNTGLREIVCEDLAVFVDGGDRALTERDDGNTAVP